MLLEDAAGSSVNLKNGSAEFASVGRNSVMRDGSQHSIKIAQYSVGSQATPIKKNNSICELPLNNSQVEIGAGEINETDEDVNQQVLKAYTNLPRQEPDLRSQYNKSDISVLPIKDKSRKVHVLHADSEVDSSSVRPSILGFDKSDFSDPKSPKVYPSAFDKLVLAANKAIDGGRNGKRSHSVNQQVIVGRQPKEIASLFKQPFPKKQIERRTSEEGTQIKSVQMLHKQQQ